MLFQLHQLEQTIHSLFSFFAGLAADFQSVADILFHGHARKKRVSLKDHADAALASRQVGHVFAVENYAASIRLFEPRDDAQDRGLAAAGSAEQNQRLTLCDIEADIVEHASLLESLAEALHTSRNPRLLLAIGSPGHMHLICVGSCGHFGNHTSCTSNSSQSRAKNSTLKITKESSASTIAIAFAASIWPSLNLAKI